MASGDTLLFLDNSLSAIRLLPADLEWPPGRRDISRITGHSLLKTHLFGKSFPDYILDINLLSPVDLATVPQLRRPETFLIDW